MIELERHIEILLLNNDCVIVPDFGGFLAHHVCARYDEQDQLFLPPLRTLGFNPQLRLNDSLLAQSFIEAYDISYPEAMKRIKSQVEELRQHLHDEGQYELNDIGLIYLNDEGHYEFSPCEAGILTPKLYGLGSFEMVSVQRRSRPAEQTSADVVPAETAQPAATLAPQKAQLRIAEKSETTATTTGTAPVAHDDHSGKIIHIQVSRLRNVAAACIVALVVWLFPQQSADSELSTTGNIINTELLRRVMPQAVTTPLPQPESAPQQAAPLAAEPTAESTAEASEAPASVVAEAPKPAVAPSTHFTIVLASQVSQKNANYFVQQLHKQGFSEARVAVSGKTTRVVYGHYATEHEAYNALRPLRNSQKDFAEAWVLQMKNSPTES